MKALLALAPLFLTACNWWVPTGPMLFWCESDDLCDAVTVAVEQIQPYYPWDIAVVYPDMAQPEDQHWNRWYVYRFSGEREELDYCGEDGTMGAADRDDTDIIIGDCVKPHLLVHAVMHEIGHAFGLEDMEDDPVMQSKIGNKRNSQTFGEKVRNKLRSFW